MPTSNSEYGRFQGFANLKNGPGNSGMMDSYNNSTGGGNYPQNFYAGYGQASAQGGYGDGSQMMYVSPGQGHVHSPNCPNYNAANAGQTAYTPQNVIYSSGGDSQNDFEVLVGNEATAALGQEGDDSGPVMNQNQDSFETVSQYQAQGGGDSAEATNDAGPDQQNTASQMESQQVGGAPAPVPTKLVQMGLRSKTKKYRPMPVPAPVMIMSRHIYSGLRQAKGQATQQFKLCGSCTKCSQLKDPNSEINQQMQKKLFMAQKKQLAMARLGGKK